MPSRSTREYAKLTKAGFVLVIGLFLLGVAGELIGNTYFAPLPAWEASLFLDLEAIGLVIGFFSSIVFGLLLPLVER